MTLRVSAVVPTFRRPDLLDRCLAALMAQDFSATDYEVIVVDDAASEETKQQVERWAARVELSKHTIRYIPVIGVCHPHGPATARNIGWRAARGEIIAFTDDDCIPTPGWLRAGAAALTDGVAGAAGRTVVPLPAVPTDYEYNASHLQHAEFVTANCFYRRTALMMVGGFDERFTAPWREDSDLFFMLLERQAKYTCTPEAVVIHPVRPARWGISLSQQRKSMFNALLYKKHPVLYRQRIQARPPWHYYCIVTALLAALLGIVAGAAIFALGAICVWLCMTGHFCLQRLHHTSHAPRHIAEMIATSLLIPPLAVFWRIFGAIKFRVFFL
ncbi:MAG TPA: glycosyltransferase [Ktedonobacteraceae bacterium]|nr:glycosyltransferase [Ktedonobacteraceae bacterium]